MESEQIKEWVDNIYSERFTAWEDIQDDIGYNDIEVTPEMLLKIKDAVETYMLHPVQAAINEIDQKMKSAKVINGYEDFSCVREDDAYDNYIVSEDYILDMEGE